VKHKERILDSGVLEIRMSGNPQRLFSSTLAIGELKGRSCDQIVDDFEKHVFDWFFNVGENLIPNPNSNFILTSICCVIIDLLSQYIYCEPASSKSIFQRFFAEYLSDFNDEIRPPIKTCYFHKGRWMREDIKSVAGGFYHCFRCGVVHSGRILEYGEMNRSNRSRAISVVQWKNNGRIGKEIVVNPALLLRKLEEVFIDYMQNLRKDHHPLKRNFLKKFKMEYGITIEK
jgi:hypothetical protein